MDCGGEPRCFLSYTETDRGRYDLARKLGVPRGDGGEWIPARRACWFFAPLSVPFGADLAHRIEGAIQEATEFHLFWSPQAARSKWVDDELRWALQRQAELRDTMPERAETFFRVYLLEDDAAMSCWRALVQRLGQEPRFEDCRHPTAWPWESVRFLAWCGVAVAVVVSVTVVSPGWLAHVIVYSALALVGVAVGMRLWRKLDQPARALVVFQLATLCSFDFRAWARLGKFSHPTSLVWIDSAAYAALAVCLVAALFSAHRVASESRRRALSPVSLTASSTAVYAALVAWYWVVVAGEPRDGPGIRSTIENGWGPDANFANQVVQTLCFLPDVGGVDAETASIVVSLYALMGLASLVLAFVFWRVRWSDRSPDLEVMGWTWAAWLAGLAAAVYIALGPWCPGAWLWQGDTPTSRWVVLSAHASVTVAVTWRHLHRRSQGLLPTDAGPLAAPR
ncbi:MAG: hypothetical protein R3F56_09280 [Planctomycetota bacterium]